MTLLGPKINRPTRKLETFPNKHPGRPYVVTLVGPKFTGLGATIGRPDFATITIRPIPNQRIIESKSLSLYLWS